MPIRLAARAVLVHRGRLLLVNAWPGGASDLWCAPGGGVAPHDALATTLTRELREETGLTVTVGVPCLVNEFHEPDGDFHQVEVFFRCTLAGGRLDPAWQDPGGIVTRRRFVAPDEMAGLRVKPDSLPRIAFADGVAYDPLEPLVI